MDIRGITNYFKKISIYLWGTIGAGLILLILIIIFILKRHIQLPLVSYVLVIFLLNSFLAIYTASKNFMISYILVLTIILVEIYTLMIIFQ